MGFSNDSSSKTYFATFGGKFAIKCAADDPEAKKRVNKEGKTVYEKHYQSFTGLLTNIKSEKHEKYGMQLVYEFVSDNKIYEFTTGLFNSQADSINCMLPNVDVEEPITLHALPTDGGGTDVIISQDGKYAKRFWTRAEPKGRPEPKEVEFQGQKKWDYSAPTMYVLQYLKDNIIPKLTKVDPNLQKAAEAYGAPKEDPKEEEKVFHPTVDDLPF